MLLRRISNHVSKENWFAVFLDFLIVVSGVFLGLQVQKWSENRAATHQEAALMERLEYDFIATEKELNRAIKRLDNYVEQTGALIDLIRVGEIPENKNVVKAYILSAGSVAAQPPVPVSYTEMIASGGLSRLSNPELRAALNRYGQNSGLAGLNTSGALTAVTTGSPKYHSAVRRSSNPESFRGASEIIIDYDWGALKQAEPELQIIQSFQGDLANNARRQLKEIEIILALLEAEND